MGGGERVWGLMKDGLEPAGVDVRRTASDSTVSRVEVSVGPMADGGRMCSV